MQTLSIIVKSRGYQSEEEISLPISHSDAVALATTVARTLAERVRQLQTHGTGGDDAYTVGQLPQAAMAYAMAAVSIANGVDPVHGANWWPSDWKSAAFKPYGASAEGEGNLAMSCIDKACALLFAERERLHRSLMRDADAVGSGAQQAEA